MKEKIKSSRILIVDNNLDSINELTESLKSNGYTNLYVEMNSNKVMNVYKKIKPDLILIEIMFDQHKGLSIIEKIRSYELELHTPILVITNCCEQISHLKSLEAGADDFIRKPINKLEVLTRIKNLLNTHLLNSHIREEKNNLEIKIKERTKELEESQLEIINRLSLAIEYRDNETSMHVERMSNYCVELARAIGMTEEDVHLIMYASKLHDVGKIGIPDGILLKKGKLNAKEWEIMKQHTEIGERILSGSNNKLLKMARDIALTHHEKWDGTGYPKGLKGEEIPLVGRLTAICDVFDALTSSRPYKMAWSVEDTIQELIENKGKHFDPRLIDIFIKNLPKILAIKDKYKEELDEI